MISAANKLVMHEPPTLLLSAWQTNGPFPMHLAIFPLPQVKTSIVPYISTVPVHFPVVYLPFVNPIVVVLPADS